MSAYGFPNEELESTNATLHVRRLATVCRTKENSAVEGNRNQLAMGIKKENPRGLWGIIHTINPRVRFRHLEELDPCEVTGSKH